VLSCSKLLHPAAIPCGEHAAGEAEVSAQAAHCGRKISRPSCFATSNVGLNAYRNWSASYDYTIPIPNSGLDPFQSKMRDKLIAKGG
jgi:hypothetical protein